MVLTLLVTKAACQMIIHHPGRLHERVHDRRANEVESALSQVFADGIRDLGLCNDVGRALCLIYDRLAADEPPNVAVKRPELILYSEKRSCVRHSRSDLEAIANYALVLQ